MQRSREIEEHHGDDFAAAARNPDGLGETIREQRAVRQLRQRVVRRLVLHLLMRSAIGFMYETRRQWVHRIEEP